MNSIELKYTTNTLTVTADTNYTVLFTALVKLGYQLTDEFKSALHPYENVTEYTLVESDPDRYTTAWTKINDLLASLVADYYVVSDLSN